MLLWLFLIRYDQVVFHIVLTTLVYCFVHLQSYCNDPRHPAISVDIKPIQWVHAAQCVSAGRPRSQHCYLLDQDWTPHNKWQRELQSDSLKRTIL